MPRADLNPQAAHALAQAITLALPPTYDQTQLQERLDTEAQAMQVAAERVDASPLPDAYAHVTLGGVRWRIGK